MKIKAILGILASCYVAVSEGLSLEKPTHSTIEDLAPSMLRDNSHNSWMGVPPPEWVTSAAFISLDIPDVSYVIQSDSNLGGCHETDKRLRTDDFAKKVDDLCGLLKVPLASIAGFKAGSISEVAAAYCTYRVPSPDRYKHYKSKNVVRVEGVFDPLVTTRSAINSTQFNCLHTAVVTAYAPPPGLKGVGYIFLGIAASSITITGAGYVICRRTSNSRIPAVLPPGDYLPLAATPIAIDAGAGAGGSDSFRISITSDKALTVLHKLGAEFSARKAKSLDTPHFQALSLKLGEARQKAIHASASVVVTLNDEEKALYDSVTQVSSSPRVKDVTEELSASLA